MADIRIKDLPSGTPSASKLLPMDLVTTQSATIRDIVLTGRPSASQAEAEAGVDSEKAMTPLSTKQAINFQVSTSGRSGSYNDLTDKPNVATTDAIDAAVAEAEGYRDDAISVVAAIQPTTRYSFEVALGATSVTIPGGYEPGTVSQGYLNGVLLSSSSYDGINGSTVTFSAITQSDIVEGDSTATIEFFIGTSVTGFTALNAKYLSLKTGNDAIGRSLDQFGTWGSSSADHTQILTDAADSGESIFVPPRQWNVGEPITIANAPFWGGVGRESLIKLNRASGDEACAVLVATSSGMRISGLHIDGNGANLVNPAGGIPAVPKGSAVLICAEELEMDNCIVRNGWDNGIALAPSPDGTGTAGFPNDCRLSNNRTYNNGCGYHTDGGPGYIGSGLNNASGSRVIIVSHFDRGSRGAVTFDDGGGANGVAIGCVSFENAGDDNVGIDNNTPSIRGTGTAFYAGTPDVSFIGCQAFFPYKHGFWVANECLVDGCLVVGAREHGYLITGGKNRIIGSRAKNIGQKTHNTYSGFFIDTPFGNSEGNIVSDPVCEWDDAVSIRARYGYAESSYLGNLAECQINGGRLNGATSGVSALLGKTTLNLARTNDVLVFYTPVAGPGSLPGSAIYRDSNGFIKTV